ncbi:hypothetical protein ACLOJK_035420 [Asimina triloba]
MEKSNQFYGPSNQKQSQAFFPRLQVIDVSFNNLDGGSASASEFLVTRMPYIDNYYQDRVMLVSKGLEFEFVKILTALIVIDLSHNQLLIMVASQGPLESSSHLVVLVPDTYMSHKHNHFQGQIPPSLANLSQNSLHSYPRAFRTAFQAIVGHVNFKGPTFLGTFSPHQFEGGSWSEGGDCVRTRPFKSNETRLEGMNLEVHRIQVEEFRRAREEGKKRGVDFQLLDIKRQCCLDRMGIPAAMGTLAK